MHQPSHNAGTRSQTGPAHSERPLSPSSTDPSPKQVLVHQPCQDSHRRHHGVRQHHHPAHIHPHAPVVETPQRHAPGIRRRPCGRCNTAPPLVPSSKHLLQNDAHTRESDSETPPSSDPGDLDLGFPLKHPEHDEANCNDDASARERHWRRHHRPP